ncbi:MAG: hypothetical protein CMN87_20010 [Stappia sp.]|uniref:DUF6456 domain-containing protein n=1 Tax=Stappia sp. TaxID=1870903 RepID=UPI000C426DBC|nr:DUF6456 domain-containing protein [Stappia sp.]MAA99829.1 hypothetical protein [Stappia sp.]MBM22294.1 hypothetical protein [Stappia sp.]
MRARESAGPAGDAVSPRAIERVLARLAGARDWRIAETGDAFGGTLTLRSETRSGRLVLDASLVDTAVHLGLVDRRGETVTLARAGIARLRRARAGGDEDAFRRQHQLRGSRRIPEEGGRIRVVEVDDSESPLAWLRRRRGRGGAPMIDEAQFAAGERLRADHARAGIGPALASPAWSVLESGVGGGQGHGGAGGMADLHDATVDARARVERARSAVGPELFPVLVDVCCDLKGLEEVERGHRWPARSAKLILSLALTRLARHYGYAERAG